MCGQGGPSFANFLVNDETGTLSLSGGPTSDVATATGLARPTARRLLLTLEELGYDRVTDGGYELTPKVLALGMAYVGSLGLWDVARPHLEALVARTGESSSMAQLDGSDIVYVARVSVPKLIALRVDVGTRFPAVVTSQGKVLLAALPHDASLHARWHHWRRRHFDRHWHGREYKLGVLWTASVVLFCVLARRIVDSATRGYVDVDDGAPETPGTASKRPGGQRLDAV